MNKFQYVSGGTKKGTVVQSPILGQNWFFQNLITLIVSEKRMIFGFDAKKQY